jgi:uncharacterized protein (DUF779 family)
MYVERISITEKAKEVIEQLWEQHRELIFHQSGGCCDGSAPMCFEKGDFLIGFSLEIPLGLRFMAISRLLSEDELRNIRPIET